MQEKVPLDVKDDCSLQELEDIGNVNIMKNELLPEENICIKNAKVVVVQHLDTHKTCLCVQSEGRAMQLITRRMLYVSQHSEVKAV